MALGGRDFRRREVGEGQGVEVTARDIFGGRAQDVAKEACADNRRGEGRPHALMLAQGVFGLLDLVSGEAARLQHGVIDRGALGQRSVAQRMPPGGIEIDALR